MSLIRSLVEYVTACFVGIWIESHEHEDALAEIGRRCHDEGWRLAMWNVADGLQMPGMDADINASGPLAAIRAARMVLSASPPAPTGSPATR